MRSKFAFLIGLFFSSLLFAQNQSINYKALIKDVGGNVVANQTITVQFSILQGIAETNVYQETHTPTTDDNGLVILNIGNGTIDSGVFADITWGSDDHFLNVQIDTGGGLIDMGTTQFMAVPYALNAANAASKIDELSDGKSDIDGSDNGSSIFLGIDAGSNDDGTDNKNVGVGFQSLFNNTSGINNAANGFQALFNNTDGSSNTANGYGALYSNTEANGNTASGYLSLKNTTTGSFNTASGYEALLSNIEGWNNIANGYRAGYNSIGSGNIFIGYQSGYNETNSDKLYIENSDADAYNALIYGEFDTNILRTNSEFQIGNPAGTGYSFPATDGSAGKVLQTDGSGSLSWVNGSSLGVQKINDLADGKSDNDGSDDGSSIFLGIGAGQNDNGSNNKHVGIGYLSLASNTSGHSNVAMGFNSLTDNINGFNNIAIGTSALLLNSSGWNNTAVGFEALSANSGGHHNTSIGDNSLKGNSSGEFNTAIGSFSLNKVNGNNNTAIGAFTGFYNLEGINNVFIGRNSGMNELGSNNLYIENSDADANNALIYGFFGGDNTATDNILRTNSQFQIGNPTGTGFAFPTNDGTTDQILKTDGNGSLVWASDSDTGAHSINDLADGKSDNNGSSIFLGINAGLNDDGTDNQNIGLGNGALENNTTGNLNVAIGSWSLHHNTTGFFNTALGRNSLGMNTSGTQNTATGAQALSLNNGGSANTASGFSALVFNSSGNFNTATGNVALAFNTLGSYNTANGASSLEGNTSGDRNVASGYRALNSNTDGNENTAMGADALYNNDQGQNNTGVGSNALLNNNGGNGNTATGSNALLNNNGGSNNTANGFESLYSNTSGSDNVGIGRYALYNNTSGNNNTAVGFWALSNATGSNNTALGLNAQVPSNSGSNQVRIGNTDVTYAGVQVAWDVTSDKRWKENIREIPYGLDVVKQLKPVDYVRKNNAYKTREMGFIAQDVAQLLEKIGYDDQGFLHKDDNGYMSLRYNDLFALLTKSIQEQQDIIEYLKDENIKKTAANETQNKNYEQLLKRVEQLEKINNQ